MKIGRSILRLAASAVVALTVAGAAAGQVWAATSGSTANSSKSGTSTGGAGTNSTGGTTVTGKNGADTGVQGYAADSALQFGTIVRLAGTGAAKVEPVGSKDLSEMYGVTVDPHTLSLSISDNSLPNEAFVATSGTYDVLVSTQSGTIKPGDYVTVSSLDGVAMKAGSYEDQKVVFGRAAGGFDGKAKSVGSTTLQYDGGGTARTVQLGLIPVAINIERNPNEKSTKANLPPALQKLGQAIADKPVSPLRIYLSIAVTGLSIIISLVTLYAGIRNAMIAIGRNPLSKKSIFRGLLEIILTGFLILIIGLFAVYLLLKL